MGKGEWVKGNASDPLYPFPFPLFPFLLAVAADDGQRHVVYDWAGCREILNCA